MSLLLTVQFNSYWYWVRSRNLVVANHNEQRWDQRRFCGYIFSTHKSQITIPRMFSYLYLDQRVMTPTNSKLKFCSAQIWFHLADGSPWVTLSLDSAYQNRAFLPVNKILRAVDVIGTHTHKHTRARWPKMYYIFTWVLRTQFYTNALYNKSCLKLCYFNSLNSFARDIETVAFSLTNNYMRRRRIQIKMQKLSQKWMNSAGDRALLASAENIPTPVSYVFVCLFVSHTRPHTIALLASVGELTGVYSISEELNACVHVCVSGLHRHKIICWPVDSVWYETCMSQMEKLSDRTRTHISFPRSISFAFFSCCFCCCHRFYFIFRLFHA